MKRMFAILSVFLLFNPLFAQEENIDWLKNNAHAIKSVSADTFSVNDIGFLKKYLKGVDIVAMGEQTHGDGATIAAKVELIKYLHEELGFNVIAFESSMLDCYRENNNFMEGKKTAAEAITSSVFPVWAKSKPFQELIGYISGQKKSGDLLRFAGFDAQPMPIAPAKERFAPAEKILNELGIESTRESNPYLYDLFFNPRSFFAQKPDSAEQEKILESLKDIGNIIFQKGAGAEGKIVGKSIEGTADIFYLFWNADFRNPKNTPGIFNIRDRLMGEFIIFLKEEIYPDEKIILWGANSHLNYRRDEIVEGSEQKMIPAGDYVKKHFGDKYYSIAFTSYEGKAGTPGKPARDVPPANENSIEAMLAMAGFQSCFLDLRGIDAAHWLDEPIYGRFYGYGNFKAPWPRLTDGIFFIKEMTPNEAIDK